VADLDRDSILALDNIRLDLPVAAVASRCLACIVDGFFVVVLILILLLLCSALMLWSRAWGRVAIVAGAFLIDWGYFAGMEVTTRGRTLGKMTLDLRVVTTAGAEPTSGALLLRNLVRWIDLFVGVPLMAWDPLARRLGDRLAGTLVVHAGGREAATVVLGRVPAVWGAREVVVVERFMARAGSLHDLRARDEMALRLLALVERDAPDLVAGLDRRDPLAALRQALEIG
jgi:uncharacterized RDD family membrane protein YckC